jgi:hypothetical protein
LNPHAHYWAGDFKSPAYAISPLGRHLRPTGYVNQVGGYKFSGTKSRHHKELGIPTGYAKALALTRDYRSDRFASHSDRVFSRDSRRGTGQRLLRVVACGDRSPWRQTNSIVVYGISSTQSPSLSCFIPPLTRPCALSLNSLREAEAVWSALPHKSGVRRFIAAFWR